VKTRQRLSILVAQHRWEAAWSLSSRIARLGMLEDQDVRYALAYVAFRTERYEASSDHLDHITDGNLLDAVADLRRALAAKRESGS